MKTKTVSATILCLLVAGTALAHHSFAMFDNKSEKTLTGTVKEFQWTNPHIWVQVMVKNATTGQEEEWSIEGGSPNGLSRRGWSRKSMKPGDQIVIRIHPMKDGSNGGSLMDVSVNGQAIGAEGG